MSTASSWQYHDHLTWLGREAPRYTSYPSAHHFETVAEDAYGGRLANLGQDKSVGLYVHVPFCEQMCWFCGCNTQITRRYDPIGAYVDNLIAEITLVSATIGFRPTAHALHFGGGSPGILSVADMTRLMEAINTAFDLHPDAEVSIELDPRRVTPEKAINLGNLGFNRVSLGIQDTQGEVQNAINRFQPMELVTASLGVLRDAGLSSLGIDLIYGLPLQTETSLEKTLKDVSAMAPDRISAFSYAHVPWARKHQRLIDDATLPDVSEKARQYLQIDHQLRAMGYAGVGMDHFALPNDGLARAVDAGTLRRNFMGYTDLPNDRLIALGASSISELDEGLAQNIPQATSYATRVNEGRLATVKGWAYRDDDRMRRDVISSLMCRFEVDLGAIRTRYGLADDYFAVELEGLGEFVSAGLVSLSGNIVRFHSPLKMLVRPVAAVFDRYARASAAESRYSRVA